MDSPAPKLNEFTKFVRKHITGDEKGEAQIFCDRLFRAFGHDGAMEAGGKLEYRIHKGNTTRFADLLWKPRCLIEMKKRGENLQKHYRQAFDYWLHLVPNRPEYVTLCNFDEFWIYDLNKQLDDPMDRVKLEELPERYTALNFLFPEKREPHFRNNLVEVTESAATKVAKVYRSLVSRGEDRFRSQRFTLQCVVALFAEDIELLPAGLFTELVEACQKGASAHDLLGGLFRQMNERSPARGGRFKDVPYFNGGLFGQITPIDLSGDELELLADAASERWSRVRPAIFGSIFQSSMDETERHAYGIHYTSEADIQQVVTPTITRPWREQIASANAVGDLLALRDKLLSYKVLDPACGSGNFLYVAYRDLKRVEMELFEKLIEKTGKAPANMLLSSRVRASQFHGIDINGFGVELAKVTMMLGKKLALDEFSERVKGPGGQRFLTFDAEQALPLDNLDPNIRQADALFCDWPKVDAIVGNPPYLDARKTTMVHGLKYTKVLRSRYPEVPGRADYCVHWFRRAHDELPFDGRAGLVGTNSIRQNYSREGGLDHIVQHGGTITEAVSSQVWSGEAAVHVSIVNWVKGKQDGKKKIMTQVGDDKNSPWKADEVEFIPSSLSPLCDVTSAGHIQANRRPKKCLEGQQPGHKAFCIGTDKFKEVASADPDWRKVLHPILNGDDLLSGAYESEPNWVIDLGEADIFQAKKHAAIFRHLQAEVVPDWSKNAANELAETGKKSGEHQKRIQHWWLLKRRRGELLAGIEKLSRYIVCSAVTKRPIFVFVAAAIRPSNALKAFLFEDDYSFGVLQSEAHWEWFKARCSTLKGDYRYTPDTVFDTFRGGTFEFLMCLGARPAQPPGLGIVPGGEHQLAEQQRPVPGAFVEGRFMQRCKHGGLPSDAIRTANPDSVPCHANVSAGRRWFLRPGRRR